MPSPANTVLSTINRPTIEHARVPPCLWIRALDVWRCSNLTTPTTLRAPRRALVEVAPGVGRVPNRLGGGGGSSYREAEAEAEQTYPS